MIDRDVCRTLLEVINGITALVHRVVHQGIRLSDGVGRVVDEARLHLLPAKSQRLRILAREWHDLEAFDARAALIQLRLGAAPIADVSNRLLILGPELLS